MENQSIATLSHDDSSLRLLIDRGKESQDDDTIMSDAKYAEELLFQEVLMASLINPNTSLHLEDDSASEKSSKEVVESSSQKGSMEVGESSQFFQEVLMASLINPNTSLHLDDDSASEKSSKEVVESSSQKGSMEVGESSQFLCEICAESKDSDQMFAVQRCNHHFCTECISKHISVRIQKSPISDQENGRWFVCPGLDCKGILEIDKCMHIVPKDVLTMWGDVICESMIAASQKFYCPYKDCSALLVNDGEEIIRESECPFCRRLFCAQCNVPWHSGVGCEEFLRLNESERGREDLMVHELAKLEKWQRCPDCKFFVEKNQGCLHMTCRCGFQFCYACGATWKSSHHESCQ